MNDTSPLSPPRRLLLGASQATEEEQLLNIEQRLREVSEQEAPLTASGPNGPAPKRRERRRLFLRPRAVGIHFSNVPHDVGVSVQRRISQGDHVHLENNFNQKFQQLFQRENEKLRISQESGGGEGGDEMNRNEFEPGPSPSGIKPFSSVAFRTSAALSVRRSRRSCCQGWRTARQSSPVQLDNSRQDTSGFSNIFRF